jgi:eukaryotic-like serine/threonine-protein kinase
MGSLHDIDVGVREGDVLAGKYRVERILGVGGMGVVVAAHHLQLDEKVALKFLLPDAVLQPEAVARFDREARAAVKIKSDHVARVTDVGKLESGSPYMVMEYLEGDDLSGWLEKNGPLPIEQAVDFVLQACEAIAEAHSIGIVHRDLKPANLFCIRRPNGQLSIKVLDFGISKLGGAAEKLQMTRTSTLVGSPFYMSPEQMQTAKGVDSRTDIWSLGIILFELLTGRVPFDSPTVTDLAIRVATEPPPPVTSLRGDVPPGLEKAILTCLEKPRERRYQDVGELALAIAPFGSRHAHGSLERIQGTLGPSHGATELATSPRLSPAASTRGPVGSTQGSWQTQGAQPQPKRGSPAIAVIAGVVGVGVLVAGGVFFVMKARAPVAPPSQASASSAPSTEPPASTPPATIAAASASLPPSPAVASSAPPVSPATPVTATATKAAVASPIPRATVRPTASASPAPAPSPVPTKAHCDPPYFFDAQGNRVFKKECL